MKLLSTIKRAPAPLQIGITVIGAGAFIYGAYKVHKYFQNQKLLNAQQNSTVTPGAVNPSTGQVLPASQILTYNIAGEKLPASGVSLAQIAGDIHNEIDSYPYWYSPDTAFAAIRQTPVRKTKDLQALYQNLYSRNLLDDLRDLLSTDNFLKVKFFFK